MIYTYTYTYTHTHTHIHIHRVLFGHNIILSFVAKQNQSIVLSDKKKDLHVLFHILTKVIKK